MKKYIDRYTELLNAKIFNAEFVLCSKIVKLNNKLQNTVDSKEKIELLNEVSVLKNFGILSLLIEIFPGIGGKESELFMENLLCMYIKYCIKSGIKYELLHQCDKEIILRIYSNRYDLLKNEIGTHRVQRVPKTESKGRVHTSSAVVNVIPEYTYIEYEIKETDLKIERMRASGPGGQNVNKVETAIRITHLPTKVSAQCQSERSQYKNLENAKYILFNRVKQYYINIENTAKAIQKNKICKNTDRSDKFRTYNYEQNRVTDHKQNIKCNLSEIVNGNLNLLFSKE